MAICNHQPVRSVLTFYSRARATHRAGYCYRCFRAGLGVSKLTGSAGYAGSCRRSTAQVKRRWVHFSLPTLPKTQASRSEYTFYVDPDGHADVNARPSVVSLTLALPESNRPQPVLATQRYTKLDHTNCRSPHRAARESHGVKAVPH